MRFILRLTQKNNKKNFQYIIILHSFTKIHFIINFKLMINYNFRPNKFKFLYKINEIKIIIISKALHCACTYKEQTQ